MKVKFAKYAVKAITSLDARTKQRIRSAIQAIPSGDIKPIQGSKTLYRLRVGDWRVLFSYILDEDGDDAVMVERISPRGEVYKSWRLK